MSSSSPAAAQAAAPSPAAASAAAHVSKKRPNPAQPQKGSPPPLPSPFKYPAHFTVSDAQLFANCLDAAALEPFLSMHQYPDNLTAVVVAHALYPYIFHTILEHDDAFLSVLVDRFKQLFGDAPFAFYESREKLGIVPRKPETAFRHRPW